MIHIKSKDEINKMRSAGRLAFEVLEMVSGHIVAGVSTEELDRLCHQFILKNKAIPAPLNYRGFPKSICTSINNVVCHGIPNERDILKNGDIINVDVTVIVDGFHGDSSRTFFVGNEISEEARLLVERTRKAMEIGIQAVKPGGYFCDIGIAIDRYISQFGYGIVRDLGGHGIGRQFHEDPLVFHHRQKKKRGPKIKEGMTFTVEPMINAGDWQVTIDRNDGWTVYSKDNSLSAQFEHTLVVTEKGAEILTTR